MALLLTGAAPVISSPVEIPGGNLLPADARRGANSTAPVSGEIPVALLVDITTGQVLFSREPDRRFVPASVTKVMTAYTAFELIAAGELRLDMPYLYSQQLEDEWYNEGSNMFLLAGERPTIAQLLLGITTISGNDASVAMALATKGSLEEWLALMNANAEKLGMRDTHFGSPNGFPDGGQTYTTANDLVLLGRAVTLDHPVLYRQFFGHRTFKWRELTQANHDPVTGRVDGADGLKTGYTNEAGFTFLGSAERDGRRLMMVLAGAPDGRIRDTAARDLLEWGFEGFDRTTLYRAQTLVGTAQVQDGTAREVGLRLPQDFTVALPEGSSTGEWTTQIVYRGPIVAPIVQGDRVATLRLSIDGETAFEAPLEATSTVVEANPLQRIANAFARWIG
ncbi:MAG: D-alanyl-D-alanine carboxypeptidase family protein [Alteraurantiacibacter sp.]